MSHLFAPPVTLSLPAAMSGYAAVCRTLNLAYGDTSAPSGWPGIAGTDHPVRQGDGDPAWYTDGPLLVADYDLTGHPVPWAVVWETGPWWWADYIPFGGTEPEFGTVIPPTTLPAGVFADTLSSFALSLYTVPEGA